MKKEKVNRMMCVLGVSVQIKCVVNEDNGLMIRDKKLYTYHILQLGCSHSVIDRSDYIDDR